MGQSAAGLLFGVVMPKGVVWEDDLTPENGVYYHWYKFSGERYRDGHLSRTYDCKQDLIGYWVKLPHRNRVDLRGEPIRFDSIKKTKAYKKAVRSYRKFATWASKRYVKLGTPELWIAPTEIA